MPVNDERALSHFGGARQLEIETPEQVAIGFELADLGSRFLAFFIDGILLLLGILGIGGVASIILDNVSVAAWLANIGAAVLILVIFALFWGYFMIFEGFASGQTPGKRWVRLRVIHDGGYPVTFRGAALRNLVRLVDIQPLPTCLIGGTTMMFHPRTKRLGDLVAGTVVVRERYRDELPEEAAALTRKVGGRRLTTEQFVALGDFVRRGPDLPREVRERVSASLAAALAEYLPDDMSSTEAGRREALERLHRDEAPRHTTASGDQPALSPQAALLVRTQRSLWREYESMVTDAQKKGLTHLPEEEVSKFAAAYRTVSADLARARTYGGSPPLLFSLEKLVGEGHNLLYRPARRSWKVLVHWITGGFPRLVRKRWVPIALSAALFWIPAIVTFGVVRADPSVARQLLPPGFVVRAEEAESRRAQGLGYVDVPEVTMPVFASQLISNNVQVTFLAFAGGALAGIGTALILMFNGVHLGSAFGLFANYGVSIQLWSFVVSHGVIELSAIWIAGGAGLWMGSAFILPGRKRRVDALVERGKESVSLLAGTTLMLVLAGVIEAFVSPARIPDAARFVFAALVALAFILYIVRAGRSAESPVRAAPAA